MVEQDLKRMEQNTKIDEIRDFLCSANREFERRGVMLTAARFNRNKHGRLTELVIETAEPQEQPQEQPQELGNATWKIASLLSDLMFTADKQSVLKAAARAMALWISATYERDDRDEAMEWLMENMDADMATLDTDDKKQMV